MSEELISELRRLSPEEELGRQIYVNTGQRLNYAEFIFLLKHPDQLALGQLHLSSSVREQELIREEYEKFRENGLTEEAFFPPDADIVVEKLLHYVDIPPHAHEFFECACILRGTCIHRINGTDYRQEAGSFVNIPPHTIHALLPEEDCLCLTVKYRRNTVMKLAFPSVCDFLYPLAFRCGSDPFVEKTVLELYRQQTEKKLYYDLLIPALFQSLMIYILQNYEDKGDLLLPNARQSGKILKILNYAMDHYKTVTVHDAAEHFHYNDSYFSRMYREETGETFTSSVRAYKLYKAAALLRDTELGLEDICDEIGYKDVPRFIRNFKGVYHMTPGKYRKSQKASGNRI